MNKQLPVAGWLSLSFSIVNIQWKSYFFVLLDTEIRVYEHELADTPLETLYLDKVLQVVKSEQAFTFQLELSEKHPWAIQCETEADMKLWMRAIKDRRTKYTTIHIMSDTVPLLKRRNKKLSPIITHSAYQPLITSISCTSSISSSSSLHSPSNTHGPPLYDQSTIKEIEPYYNPKNIFPTSLPLTVEEDELCPTFLLYKKRFRL